jgi:hypothetical protein
VNPWLVVVPGIKFDWPDIFVSVKPREEELNCVKLILDCFGEASGLVTNLHKSCAIPIRCEDELLQEGCTILQCTLSSFPSNYLGLPISDKKFSRNILMNWVDKIADRLPNWKARLLNLAGRTALVRFVLSAIPVYLFLAMNVPKWVINKIDRIRKGFVWRGRKEANGGSCLVAWDIVTRPLKYGGLGIPNLQHMCWALQTKWLWLQKTDRNRPWHGLSIPIQQHVKDLFATSLFTHVGNGSNTLFWTDKWLNGCSIRDLAPEVVSKVAKRALISMIVDQALENRQWITHIKPPLSLVGIQQFLFLWDTLGEVQLSQEEDHHVWRHEASGLFSSKSCYNVLFFGSTVFEPWKRLWKTWAPPKCKFFL